MEKNKKNYSQRITVAVLVALVLLLGGAYAWLTFTVSGEKENTVIIGNLELSLKDGEAIYVENAIPIEDTDGLNTTPYQFTLKNDGNIDSDYEIYLDDDSIGENEKRMEDIFLKYSVTTNGISTGAKKLDETENRKIYSGRIKVGQEQTFDLRLWMDIAATNDAMDTVFAGKIRVEASQVKE